MCFDPSAQKKSSILKFQFLIFFTFSGEKYNFQVVTLIYFCMFVCSLFLCVCVCVGGGVRGCVCVFVIPFSLWKALDPLYVQLHTLSKPET